METIQASLDVACLPVQTGSLDYLEIRLGHDDAARRLRARLLIHFRPTQSFTSSHVQVSRLFSIYSSLLVVPTIDTVQIRMQTREDLSI